MTSSDKHRVVLLGLSAAGKSSYALLLKKHLGSSEIIHVDDYKLTDSTKADDLQEKQLGYLESYKSIYSSPDYLNNHTILDRDFVSTLAFNYAACQINQNKNLYISMVDHVVRSLEGGEFELPDLYIYLDVSNNERRVRRGRHKSKDRKEKYFLEPFSSYLRYFYRNWIKELDHILLDGTEVFKIPSIANDRAEKKELKKRNIINWLEKSKALEPPHLKPIISDIDIGVEGTPYVGKTTFAEGLIQKPSKIDLIPEHMKMLDEVLSDQLEFLSVLENQKKFLEVEKKRWGSKRCEQSIFDRTLFSIMAYAYAKTYFDDNHLDVMRGLTEYCNDLMALGQIKIPKTVYYLQASYETIMSRVGSNNRGCDDFFFSLQNINLLNQYYEEAFSLMPELCVTKVNTDE